MAIGPLHPVLPWQDEEVEKNRNRYFGEYLGFCRDRSDPAKLGRVRVHVPALTSPKNVDSSWLDWCLPKHGNKSVIVPPVGMPVVVTFEQGLVTHGLYAWGWVEGSDANSSTIPLAGKEMMDPTWLDDETFTNGGVGPVITHKLTKDPARTQFPKYPWNKVYESEGGHIVEIDDSPGAPRGRYRHPAGATILVDPDGSIHLRTPGAIFQESGGDHVVALKAGASFKVIYPGGTSFIVGASGFHVSGHQATLLGRTIIRKEVDI